MKGGIILMSLPKIIYEADLDFANSELLTFVVKQTDNVRTILFHLYANGEEYRVPYESDSFAVYFKQRFSNGSFYVTKFTAKECNATENTITLPLSATMLSIAGKAQCDIVLYDGVNLADITDFALTKTAQKLTSQTFYLQIEESVGGKEVSHTQETFDILTLLTLIQNAVQEEKGYTDSSGIEHKGRATKEAEREQAELQRQQQESIRVHSEVQRNKDEKVRKEAEQQRIQAEKTRASEADNYVAQSRSYAEQAGALKEEIQNTLNDLKTGVVNFNGRTGKIRPQVGDYDDSMITVSVTQNGTTSTMTLRDFIPVIMQTINEALIKTVFKTQISNSLITTEEGYVLDARQGKVLMDKINALETEMNSLITSGTTALTDNKSELKHNHLYIRYGG